LFLDEFYEYGTKNLEALRQPLEDRIITISRAQGAVTFPANFILMKSVQLTHQIGGHRMNRHLGLQRDQ